MILSKIHRKRIFYKNHVTCESSCPAWISLWSQKKTRPAFHHMNRKYQFRTRLKNSNPPPNLTTGLEEQLWIELKYLLSTIVVFCLQELKTESQFGDVFMCLDHWMVGRCWTFCFPELMAQWRKNSHISQRNAGVLYPRHLRNFICYARTSDNLVIWLILCKKLLAYWSYWGGKMEWTIIAWAYV